RERQTAAYAASADQVPEPAADRCLIAGTGEKSRARAGERYDFQRAVQEEQPLRLLSPLHGAPYPCADIFGGRCYGHERRYLVDKNRNDAPPSRPPAPSLNSAATQPPATPAGGQTDRNWLQKVERRSSIAKLGAGIRLPHRPEA